jgi:acyl-coenzyme A thioesterase PaaI-like protein
MTAAQMTAAEVGAFVRTELPQLFNYDYLTIEHADGRTCQIRQRFRESMLRPGGTISGPTLMALADFAMYVVLLSAIGPVGLAVTTNLSINFLRKGQPRAGCACGGGQAACGRRGQFAVGDVAGADRPCDINLFHSKSLEFSTVI